MKKILAASYAALIFVMLQYMLLKKHRIVTYIRTVQYYQLSRLGAIAAD